MWLRAAGWSVIFYTKQGIYTVYIYIYIYIYIYTVYTHTQSQICINVKYAALNICVLSV